MTLDQIEVSVFGPGFGESILIHIGGGQWIVVDSCVNSSKESVALAYLRDQGYGPDAVKLIVATHWHDDHVRGLSQLLKACHRASFVVPSAMAAKSFMKMALARKSIIATSVSTGVDEITEVYKILKDDARTATKAKSNTKVFAASGSDLAHGYDCTVTALSPSDKQLDAFYDDIAALIPDPKKTETRCIGRSENHVALVALVKIGPLSILLGADLEETAHPETGWTVIVKSELRDKAKAAVFKIPHHGSRNAHNDDVWSEMLVQNSFAILTPYGRGSRLPQISDVMRISQLTKNAFSTSRPDAGKSRTKRVTAVDRTLRESGIVIRNSEPPLGHVRLRNGGVADFEHWEVRHDDPACRLDQWTA